MTSNAEASEHNTPAQHRYFTFSDSTASEAKSVTAIGKPEYVPQLMAATANFDNCASGHYRIRWRVKLLDNYTVQRGLHFSAYVEYGAEHDFDGTLDETLDVFMPEYVLKKELDRNQWYDLEIEETLNVKPHGGSAGVQLALCNIENQGGNSGLSIERVEISPSSSAEEPNGDVIIKVVSEFFNHALVLLAPEDQNGAQDGQAKASITKLAASESSNFLASLALSDDTAYITVWNMNTTSDRAVAEIQHRGISDIHVGLAISATGDQVAIYQEPKKGDWKDGSDMGSASLSFQIFNNPLAPSSDVKIKFGEKTETLTHPDSDSVPKLEEFKWKDNPLERFIFFGKFLPGTSSIGGASNNNIGEVPASNAYINTPQHESMFVACNGLYIDVFQISTQKEWTHMHSIGLADLTPTTYRRATCKMMMESISNNRFIWLEDEGFSCTVWNLLNGSNISYISAGENSFMGRDARFSKMALSPTGSIVALTTSNDTLTTYFANTGVPIDSRIFPGFKIEYIGFHGADNELFVVLRSRASAELNPRIMDPLQLNSELKVNQMPIPNMDSTILAFFKNTPRFNGGVVCEGFRSKINFYITYDQASFRVDKGNDVVAKLDDNVAQSLAVDSIKYSLEVGYSRELDPEGARARYWVHHVRVIQENSCTKNTKTIFSFVPEPWMRTPVTKADPSTLMSAFYLPDKDKTRFAVVGTQTIQIWRLPTLSDPKFRLQFIWSKPKSSESIEMMNSKNRHRVAEYYSEISDATIHMNVNTGSTVADIEMTDGKIEKDVNMTGPAAYAYSKSEINKAEKSGSRPIFTFEAHAEAIIQFTGIHLNRQRPANVVFLQQQLGPQVDGGSMNGSVHLGKYQQVTLLTLLLDREHLHKANYAFVLGLLGAEGGFWIPSDDGQLNPIKRAIDLRERPLVELMIKYGVKYAKLRHPAYLIPVMQCLEELSIQYSDLVAYMFKMSSYIPAHNHGYLKSHMIVAGSQYEARFKSILEFFFPGIGFEKSNNLYDYDNPVFALRKKYGALYWLIRFSLVLFFVILMVAITTAQVIASPISNSPFDPDNPIDYSAEIAERYLPNWHGVIYTAIANGLLLLGYEVMQFWDDWKKYVRSPYNYMDVITYSINVVGCILFLSKKPTGGLSDYGPSQTPLLSFAILALYLNLVSFKTFVMNYQFAGRYDPVSESLDSGSTSFRIMMLIFFMFTAILLLNILIALMNDAFELSKSQGEVAWYKQLSEVIGDVERFVMPVKHHEKRDYFPDYIYYYAPEQEAENYESEHRISNKSKLSPENQFLMGAYERITAVQQAQNKRLEDALRVQNQKLEGISKNVGDHSGPDPESTQLSRVTTFEFDCDADIAPYNTVPVRDTPGGRETVVGTRIDICPLSTSFSRSSTMQSPRRQYTMESVPSPQ
ncbi:hypothetical protein BGX26_003056 [Mortierella sp. AD094]|nr:hypothetical protein BGX26_003056 [Mortierella sp. AD094]